MPTGPNIISEEDSNQLSTRLLTSATSGKQSSDDGSLVGDIIHKRGVDSKTDACLHRCKLWLASRPHF